jgi:cell volume regulation protein A
VNSAEPTSTALLLTALGALMGVSVLFSRFAGRAGIPVALFFIFVGVLAGSEGIGGITFEDYAFTFRIGAVALVLILFDGGLNTPLSSVKEVIRPAALLATVGVLLTAAVVAVAGRLLGLEWIHAMLLGSIVSSTDAAAVFSVLRGSGIHLKRRVGATLELESGLNDPMAIILTVAMTGAVGAGELTWWRIALDAALNLVVGGAAGIGIGYLGREILKRAHLPAGGLYPVLTLALAFVAFGVPTLLQGSGFLAVYLAAVMMGNTAIRYRSGVLRVHDAVAWFAQVTMFLVLGLLVFPSQLIPVAPVGLAIGATLAIIARPISVIPLLLAFKYSWRERIYVGWVGLRGAVPIILATFPVLAEAPGAKEIFNIVFFVVVVSAVVPGASVQWLTRRLGLVSQGPPPPPAVLEITSTHLLSGEVVGFHVEPASAVAGASIADLPFPPTANAALIVRGSELVAPKGSTVLQTGDHVYVFCKTDDLPLMKLMFGRQETED